MVKGNKVPVERGALNKASMIDGRATIRDAYNINVTQNESRNDRGFPHSMDKRLISNQLIH